MSSYTRVAQLPVAIYTACFQDTNPADFFRKPKFSCSVKQRQVALLTTYMPLKHSF